MDSLIHKLKCKIVRIKLKKQEKEKKLNDDFKYVKAQIKKHGAQKFQYASSYIRGDAEYILELVKDYPDVLEYADENIIDRYVSEDGFYIEEEPVDELSFVIKCLEINPLSYFSLEDKYIKQYEQAIKEEKIIKCKLHGKEFDHEVKISENDLILMQEMLTDEENVAKYSV